MCSLLKLRFALTVILASNFVSYGHAVSLYDNFREGGFLKDLSNTEETVLSITDTTDTIETKNAPDHQPVENTQAQRTYRLQQPCSYRGYDVGIADSLFGPITDRAIREYPRDHTPQPTASLQTHLERQMAQIDTSRAMVAKNEADLSQSEALELQHLLNKAGYHVGRPNGAIGKRTKDAVESYKRDHPDWKVDSGSLRSFLGFLRTKQSEMPADAQGKESKTLETSRSMGQNNKTLAETSGGDTSIGVFGETYYRAEFFISRRGGWCTGNTASLIVERDWSVRIPAKIMEQPSPERTRAAAQERDETKTAFKAVANQIAKDCPDVEQMRVAERMNGRILSQRCALKSADWAPGHSLSSSPFHQDRDPCAPEAVGADQAAKEAVKAYMEAQDALSRADSDTETNQMKRSMEQWSAFRRGSFDPTGKSDMVLMSLPSYRTSQLIYDGKYQEAIDEIQRLLAKHPDARFERTYIVSGRPPPPDYKEKLLLLTNLGTAYEATGDLFNAITAYREAIDIDKEKLEASTESFAAAIRLGGLYERTGRYEDALATYQGTLASYRSSGNTDRRLLIDRRRALHTRIAAIYHAWSIVNPSAYTGALEEAESHYRTAIQVTLEHSAQTREAQPPEDVFATLNSGIMPDAIGFAIIPLVELARFFFETGRPEKVMMFLPAVLKADRKESGPLSNPWIKMIEGRAILAATLTQIGDLDWASAAFAQILPHIREQLGNNHPTLAFALAHKAELELHLGKWAEALTTVRQATRIYTDRASSLSTSPEINQRATLVRSAKAFAIHLAAIWKAFDQETEPKVRDELIAEGFEIAQWIANSSAGKALAQMAARFGARDDQLGQLVRQRQDMIDRWHQLDTEITQGQNRDTAPTLLMQEQRKILEKIQSVDQIVGNRYPEYRELVSSKPRTITELGSLLRPNEALLYVHVGTRETFIWAIGKTRRTWAHVTLDAREIEASVHQLRCDLNKVEKNCTKRSLRFFDRQRAYALYRELLEPLMSAVDHWALGDGQRIDEIFLVPSGALTSLPLGVLVTKEPTGDDDDPQSLRETAWLAQKAALTVLPSPSNLWALRGIKREIKDRLPFAGVGDPVLPEKQPSQSNLGMAAIWTARGRSDTRVKVADAATLVSGKLRW